MDRLKGAAKNAAKGALKMLGLGCAPLSIFCEQVIDLCIVQLEKKIDALGAEKLVSCYENLFLNLGVDSLLSGSFKQTRSAIGVTVGAS